MVIDKNLVINKYKDLKLGVVTDSNFNVVNSYSVYLLHSKGAKRVTLSYELNIDQIEKLYNSFIKRYNAKPNLEVIVYVKPEVMVSKYCVLNTYLNRVEVVCNTCKSADYYLVDKDNNRYKIKKSNDCFMRLLNYENINLIDKIIDIEKIGISNFRIILDSENKIEIKNIIDSLKKIKVIL